VTSVDLAHAGGFLATGLAEVTDDLAALDRPGLWVVVVTFEGEVTCARFADVRSDSLPDAEWRGPDQTAWSSSLGEAAYVGGVARIRDRIAAGEVYQVNLCRTLSAPCGEPSLGGLAARLAARHPSRYAALICMPSLGLHVCSASPELFLGRRGDVVETRPIKGTGRSASDLSVKDHAENVMIVDMARNDLGRVAVTGSVRVSELCRVEAYPGLVQLVSTVTARLRPGTTWPELFAATFPPASVSGAPKSSALRVISELEPLPRGPYCGAIGYVDNRGRQPTAALAVGIRTFWLDGDELRFGTGAGITWGSQPEAEWAETELKAERLIALASAGVGGLV